MNKNSNKNIYFLCLLMLLCSFTSVYNKAHIKKIQNDTIDKSGKYNQTADLNNFPSPDSKSNFKGIKVEESKIKIFEMEISDLDSQDKTLNITLYNFTTESMNCYNKFQSIINNYPLVIQNEIVSEFNNYFLNKPLAVNSTTFNSNICCFGRSLIKRAAKKFNEITKRFTNIVSKQESECKNGFACFRANEVLIKSMGEDIDSNYKNKNQNKLKSLLKDGKLQNSHMLKCLLHLQKISIRNIGLLCANNDLVKKTFVIDSQNKIIKSKRFPEDNLDLFINCGNYIKNFNLYPEEITNAFIDSINYLLGSEQCNYFSHFFNNQKISFDSNNWFHKGNKMEKKDEKNIFNQAADFLKEVFNKSNKTDSINKPGSNNTKLEFKGNSTSTLIDRWYSCASKVEQLNKTQIEILKALLPKKLSENPNGILGGIVRGVNFKEIQTKFDAFSNPQFLISCEEKLCKLNIGNTSNRNNVSANFNATNIVMRENITLKYSCCDRICVIDYNNFNRNISYEIEADSKLEEIGNEEKLLPVDFIQMQKLMNQISSQHQKQFMEKIFTSLGLNKNNNTQPIKNGDNLIISGAEIYEIKDIDQSFIKINKNDKQKLKSAQKSLSNKTIDLKFFDENFLNEIADYIQNPHKFINDERIFNSLRLNVIQNGANKTLMDYISNLVFDLELPLFLSCIEGKCKLNKKGSNETTFDIYAADTILTKYLPEEKNHRDNFTDKKSNKTHLKNTTKIKTLHNDSQKNFSKSLFQGKPDKENRATNNNVTKNYKEPKLNFGKNQADMSNSVYENYYRPDYRDLNANVSINLKENINLKHVPKHFISKFVIDIEPKFILKQFLESLNTNFAKNFSLELECSEFFCILKVKCNLPELQNTQSEKKALYLEVTQRKAFTFETSKISLTQKKCIVKQLLLNNKYETSFFPEIDSNKNKTYKNATNQLALRSDRRNITNIITKCNLETPYTSLPISYDCMKTLIGHCQKSNFFEFYNRYTKGVASYDDLPPENANRNTCLSPEECATVTESSPSSQKELCCAAISRMLLINGSRFSLTKLITPCNGDLPEASIEPISFMGLTNKKSWD